MTTEEKLKQIQNELNILLKTYPPEERHLIQATLCRLYSEEQQLMREIAKNRQNNK